VVQSGWTAIIWAAREGHIITVKFLLDRGADIHHMNKVTDWRWLSAFAFITRRMEI